MGEQSYFSPGVLWRKEAAFSTIALFSYHKQKGIFLKNFIQ